MGKCQAFLVTLLMSILVLAETVLINDGESLVSMFS